MSRPACVTRAELLPALARPRFTKAQGVRSTVWELSKAVGLTQMGVSLREMEPGDKSTSRHFHDVEEEWVYVLSGEGFVRIGPHRLPVRADYFIGFPPGPSPHHFEATGSSPLRLLEGGERRPDEDSGWYVDEGLVWGPGRRVERSDHPPPAELGDPDQCVARDALAEQSFQHDVDALARRHYVRLSRVTGLRRQAVCWTRVGAGAHSTAYHRHLRTDEWIYVLSGRAGARVGDDRFDVGPGDFLGHPAGGAPHVMEPISELIYLMGGQIDPNDVVEYPDAFVQRVGGELRPATRA